MGRRSQYPEEFRQRAALLVLDSHRSIRDVAAELGINHETLRNWVKPRSGTALLVRRGCRVMSGWSWRRCGVGSLSLSWSGRS
ncbi:transposase [Nocardioides cynanchi]|uniref:transposase n=1 Tax=Nocardioides cynanchi TaxID=2558918 RepID=UPI0012471C8B